ncbi:MAG: hypothetical protein Q4P18_05235 [Methanobrevibacter sp.]|uniref:hypothetical protein n=1 Tax=Methanobrevibacter sp. TaxID=66852 RepID=UPI0026DF05F7|nr:hypothetical protein [Methanobrevibacter sp.]MDO5848916.1 hypothetical protein [Methanobrevibacter sp.]
MIRAVWTIHNENFEIIIDGEIKDEKVSDKKYSVGSDIWTVAIPELKFNDETAQNEYDQFVKDLIILFSEPTINQILIDAKIGEESEYDTKTISKPLIIRKIEEYEVEEIIE